MGKKKVRFRSLTLADARRMVREAIKRRGRSHRDPLAVSGQGCKYVYKDGGKNMRCIVGEAFHLAGIPDKALTLYNSDSPDQLLSCLEEDGYIEDHHDPAALSFFQMVQQMQDRGAAWGDAYDVVRLIQDLGEESEFRSDVDTYIGKVIGDPLLRTQYGMSPEKSDRFAEAAKQAVPILRDIKKARASA